MPLTDAQDMQIDLFGGERPSSEIPRMNCSNSPDCQAEVDEHQDTCPVELQLRGEFGY